jgi:Na+/melibiose symporter-like transporter
LRRIASLDITFAAVCSKEEAMTEHRYGEKDEKLEKQDEKDEKGRGEKWSNDPLGAIIWALILIWAGLVFLAENLGWLTQFELVSSWGLILVGAGLLVFLEVVVRLVMPRYRRPVVGTFIFGMILVGAGLGITFGTTPQMWSIIFALVIIAVGVGILLRGLGRRS